MFARAVRSASVRVGLSECWVGYDRVFGRDWIQINRTDGGERCKNADGICTILCCQIVVKFIENNVKDEPESDLLICVNHTTHLANRVA